MSVEQRTLLQDSLLPILRCPYCRSGFAFQEAPTPRLGAGAFGVITCTCGAFPVVDGIPIIQRTVGMFEHTTGAAEVEGLPTSDIVSLIATGRSLQALLECLTVPALRPWMRPFGWRLSQRLARYTGMRLLRARILAHRSTCGAREVLRSFYPPGGPLNPEIAAYFVHRFSQPRHLAALALVANVPLGAKPVLDVACGAGHLEHYLTRRAAPVPAVGTDMNFFQLWIARFWIAPDAHFVCANAADGLPFADDSFSASICSDAFHLIPNRTRLIGEIARAAPGRPVILTRLGNRAVMPNEGIEETIAGYQTEFGEVSASAFTEPGLVRDYLRGHNPLARGSPDAGRLEDAKWLSFVWNVPDQVPAGSDGHRELPHAVGDFGLNPIYARTATAAGDLQLRFEFPSVWYAYENHQMLSYHPRRVLVTRSQIERLDARTDPAVAELVQSFVVLGLPQRFYETDAWGRGPRP
jgi:SAM-dependent methyltransferase/uncharacterized protein YbaR (Trm112 family)